MQDVFTALRLCLRFVSVLDAGRIVDIGRHEELVARGGLYAKLAAMQFGLEAPEDATA